MKIKTAIIEILKTIIGIYLLSVSVFFTLFSWQYAKENSFIKTLYLGEKVPFAKSFIWPYYVFFDKKPKELSESDFSESNLKNAGHFIATIENAGKVVGILKLADQSQSFTRNDFDAMLAYLKIALREARMVDDSFLESRHKELRKMFREKLQASLEYQIKGYDSDDERSVREKSVYLGMRLYDEWSTWINANRDNIKIPNP